MSSGISLLSKGGKPHQLVYASLSLITAVSAFVVVTVGSRTGCLGPVTIVVMVMYPLCMSSSWLPDCVAAVGGGSYLDHVGGQKNV